MHGLDGRRRDDQTVPRARVRRGGVHVQRSIAVLAKQIGRRLRPSRARRNVRQTTQGVIRETGVRMGRLVRRRDDVGKSRVHGRPHRGRDIGGRDVSWRIENFAWIERHETPADRMDHDVEIIGKSVGCIERRGMEEVRARGHGERRSPTGDGYVFQRSRFAVDPEPIRPDHGALEETGIDRLEWESRERSQSGWPFMGVVGIRRGPVPQDRSSRIVPDGMDGVAVATRTLRGPGRS